MLVTCPSCQAKLKIPSEKVGDEAVNVKCPRCAHVMRVKRPQPAGQAAPPPPVKEKAVGSALRQETPGAVPTAGQDRGRKSKRFRFKKKILVDNAMLVEGIDISDGGLFVHTGRSFIVGSEVTVALPLPGGNVPVRATVQHNQPGVGMGLKFVGLTQAQRSHLQSYLTNELSVEAARSPEQKKTVVLLAGGSETARRIMKSKLVLEGFAVIEAMSIVEILKKMNVQVPDIIVIDWQEKAVEGVELLNRLKKHAQWKKMMKVVLSAVSDKAMQQKIMEAGADEFLAKMDTPPARLSDHLKKFIAARS
ncbi:MAG: hypothetical protein A2521_14075 [Deltaproteobacteria bacterium RIFOXYD12_FULL_57_12]|nr:MAG: hypothetical protein A2521_14075 [Deltaproteobacteria bacterium RIFOXYD12_FULL_57_12]